MIYPGGDIGNMTRGLPFPADSAHAKPSKGIARANLVKLKMPGRDLL